MKGCPTGMPRTITLSGSHPSYPVDGTFAQLLTWHLAWGTRPGCSTEHDSGYRWIRSNFAELIHEGSVSLEGAKKNLRNWANEGRLPGRHEQARIDAIFRELFGDDPNLTPWRAHLQAALKDGRDARPETPDKVDVSSVLDVPIPTAHFMGRDEQVEVLVAALTSQDQRAILIQGGPGIGKTEITKAVAVHDKLAAQFGSRRWFVPLEAATTAAAMQDAIVGALGADPAQGFQGALAALHGQRTLLILDNLETPWASADEEMATEQVLAELASIEGVAILASMRGTEVVGGAQWSSHIIDPLPQLTSRALFAAIAGSWALGDPDITRLIEALGGIPLAIKLIARQAHGRSSLTPIWKEWQRIGSNVAIRYNRIAGRLTSLPHSIELSLSTCEADSLELKLFSLLGTFPGGLDAKAVEFFLKGDAFEATERLCRLGLAFERHKVLQLLPPIRDYAARHFPLSEKEFRESIEYFVDIDLNINLLSPPNSDNHLMMTNIIMACHKKLEISEECNDIENQADCQYRLGAISHPLFQPLQHARHLMSASRLYDRIGNFKSKGQCLYALGRKAELYEKDYSVAQRYYNESHDAFAASGYDVGIAYCYHAIGKLQYMTVFCELPTLAEKRSFSTDILENAAAIFEREKMYLEQHNSLLSKLKIEYQKKNYEIIEDLRSRITVAYNKERMTNPVHLW